MPVTSKELIRDLGVVSENILAEAARQPTMFIQAARYRVGKMRKRAEAIAAYDYHVANLAMKTRNRRNASGEKPYTEGALKEKVACNSDTRRLQTIQDRAYEEEEFSKQILRAFEMRRDAIRIIADAQNREVLREGSEVDRIQQKNKLRSEARKLEERRRRLREGEDSE